MDDMLREKFRRATDDVDVPPADLAEVVRGGRRLVALRSTAVAALALLLLAGGWTLVRSLTLGQRPDPGPADRRERRPDFLLLPVVYDGPPPMPIPGSLDDVRAARAVTVAFHALLHSVGYDYDYKGYEASDGRWTVRLLDAATERELEAFIAGRREHVEELERDLASARRQLERLGEQVRAASRDRKQELLSQRATLREDQAVLARILQDRLKELRDAQAELERIRRGDGPNEILLVVAEEDERVRVVEASGPFTESEVDRIEGYSEATEDVDVWGNDYYNARWRRPGIVDDVSGVEMSGFWTGPIPSTYEERCLLEIRDEAGKVIWRVPQMHDLFRRSPPTEDRRDGWAMSVGTGKLKRHKSLQPVFVCTWRERATEGG